jgi:hypothetical protein
MMTRAPAILVAFAFLFAMSGCKQKDRGECIVAEQYTAYHQLMVGMVNGMPIFMPMPYEATRCIQWEFPDGRPAK